MRIPGLDLALTPLPAPLPIWRGTVDAAQWSAAAAAVAESGGRLVSLWGSDRGEAGNAQSELFACVAYAVADGLVWLDLMLAAGDAPRFPDLSRHFPAASRMQRACADLLGIVAEDADDSRPWLDHGAWPRIAQGAPDGRRWRPLRRDAGEPDLASATDPGDYAFVRVEGDGVHEIAVGPVHAGTIEPGHFRF
ncbi:MAG TPA: NADH-quinone oxidoreductase subunit C, partial [Burkholderiaceae bacterium]|nr:NADH-quinone oxidoreductase subunit C [Burkholderiaceae bacterium]